MTGSAVIGINYLPTSYAITGGGTPTGVDPALLENMQKLIAEREAQKGSFLESMKDANAWWSGGVAGPGEALRARAKEREEQEATTFGMKSQIAQYKAQQAGLPEHVPTTPPPSERVRRAAVSMVWVQQSGKLTGSMNR